MPCLGAEIRIRSRKSCTISSVGMFIIKKVLPSAMQGNACRSLYILCEGNVYAKMISEERKELTLDTLLASICCPRLLYLVPKVHSPLLSWRIETVTFGLHNYLTVISAHSMFLSKRLNEFALQILSSRSMSYIEQNGSIQNLQEAAFILGVARPSLSRVVL